MATINWLSITQTARRVYERATEPESPIQLPRTADAYRECLMATIATAEERHTWARWEISALHTLARWRQQAPWSE